MEDSVLQWNVVCSSSGTSRINATSPLARIVTCDRMRRWRLPQRWKSITEFMPNRSACSRQAAGLDSADRYSEKNSVSYTSRRPSMNTPPSTAFAQVR